MAEKFPGLGKIQKIGVTIGNSCPNRDGTIGRGGCIYCNNASFSPSYINSSEYKANTVDKIKHTLEEGRNFFAGKYPRMKYLAYFQSYTNTHGADTETLVSFYTAAAETKDVVGIIIGTRPDCIPRDLLDALTRFNNEVCPVMIEFGAESSHDATLQTINRCHTWDTTVDAVTRCAEKGLSVGLHFIMGLPGETQQMMLETVRRAVKLPIDTLKFHQLQIIKDTPLARIYSQNPDYVELFTPSAYAALCTKIIEIVGPTGIAIERFVSQAPENLLVAPRWGLKNYQFTHLLNNLLSDNNYHQ